MTTTATKTGTCNWCGVKVELDVSTGPGVWIDEDVQDSANEGARCPVSDSGWHEVVEAPVCRSCGDRVGGCSRCTDADGDTR